MDHRKEWALYVFISLLTEGQEKSRLNTAICKNHKTKKGENMQMRIKEMGVLQATSARTALVGSISIEEARHIMGKNFFGIEEWKVHFPELTIFLDEGEIQEKIPFPWGEKLLNAPCPFNPYLRIRDTHFAFLGCKFGEYRGCTVQFSVAGMELLGKSKSDNDGKAIDLLGLTAAETYNDKLTRLYKLPALRFQSPKNKWYLMPISQPLPSIQMCNLHEYKPASVSESFMQLFLYYAEFQNLLDPLITCLSIDEENEDYVVTQVTYNHGFVELRKAYQLSSGVPRENILSLLSINPLGNSDLGPVAPSLRQLQIRIPPP